jgi:hypothetical protein
MGNILITGVASQKAAATSDYCRGKLNVSLGRQTRLWIKAAALSGPAALLLTLTAAAQYPGKIATNTSNNGPELRAVAVLEWTGDEEHPKASRLVPICIFDGQELQDASVYLAQPEPLALESDVEYQLQKNGKPTGIFDIDTSAREQGGWVGFGKWKSLPEPKPEPAKATKIDEDNDAQSDVPVLHRKHRADDSSGSPGANAPPPDPDRPTLHEPGNAPSDSSASGDGNTGSGQAPDPDRPTLKKLPDDSASGGDASGKSGTGKLKKKSPDDDEAYVDSITNLTDPNRPHLFYGKTPGFSSPVLPSLFGMPDDMHQTVAVSDVKDRPVHSWNFTWANPDDEIKMKADLEDLARTALGLNPPPTPSITKARKSAPTRKSARPAPPPPAPAPLLDEQFHVFELAYSTGATMVLSAHTAGAGTDEKFVTLVAQPDLYGNVVVLLKNVTDAAHLDDTPRMRLIDAVDARADNRGDLLFELRGATQRQFALYRVLRGQATRIFLSSPEYIAIGAAQ